MKSTKTKVKNKKALVTSDDTNFSFNTDNVKEWRDKGIISEELASNYLDGIDQITKDAARYKEFKKNNPNASYEEECAFMGIPRELTLEEKKSVELNAQCVIDMHEFLLKNWDLLATQQDDTTDPKTDLFIGLDSSKYFGVPESMANLVYHLETLIKNLKLEPNGRNSYEAIGEYKMNAEETLKIRYGFEATTEEEADKLLNNFKTMMLEDGLRTWLAYWKVANERRNVTCKCPFIEPMKHMYNRVYQKRKTIFFCPKEKTKQWIITKILRRVFLSVERTKVEKGKSAKLITQWIEQPFLTILGGEGNLDSINKYPRNIAFSVLLSGNHEKKFNPAIYENETLLHSSSTTWFNFLTQTRAAHNYYGCTAAGIPVRTRQCFPWQSIFTIFNMQATAKANPRAAKARIKKRLLRGPSKARQYEFTDEGIWVTHNISPYKKRETEIKRVKKDGVKL